jgi:uncharacterized protein
VNLGEHRDDKSPSDPAGREGYVWAICAALALGAVVGLSVGYALPERNASFQPAVMATSSVKVVNRAEISVAQMRAAPRILSPLGAEPIQVPGNAFQVAALDPGHTVEPSQGSLSPKPATDFLDLPADLSPTARVASSLNQSIPIETVSLPVIDPAKPQIAIVLDDLGLDQKATRRAITLPAEITLSFLPYGRASQGLAAEAMARGHEVMVHIPMEPEGDADPGPGALLVDQSTDQIASLLARQLDEFPGAVGFNNHMGSRFTADVRALLPVMREARARGLLFLDSRTTANTLAAKIGEAAGATTVSRDVFLDHASGADGLLAQLDELEKTARATGQAIAIGHPHEMTLDVLEVWARGLTSKGLELAPISEMAKPDSAIDKGLLAASSL